MNQNPITAMSLVKVQLFALTIMCVSLIYKYSDPPTVMDALGCICDCGACLMCGGSILRLKRSFGYLSDLINELLYSQIDKYRCILHILYILVLIHIQKPTYCIIIFFLNIKIVLLIG